MTTSTIQLTLTAPIPEFLVGEVRAKLAYLDERVVDATMGASRDIVSLNIAASLGERDRREIERSAQRLIKALTEGAVAPPMKILERRDGSLSYRLDPMPELLRRREVVEEGLGFFAIGPLLTTFIGYLDGRLRTIADAHEATRYRFPALLSPAYLERVEYFTNFPHSLGFVTNLRPNLTGIERFVDECECVEGRLRVDPGLFAEAPAMLSPTICHHLYGSLANSRILGDGMSATAEGHCFRFESTNMVSLERVWNFTMREIIFVGKEAFVNERLARLRRDLRVVLEDLDLTYEVTTASDPFFVGTHRDQAEYQASFELKYEVRAPLPYRSNTLAVGSYNRHGDFFGRRLNILCEDGSFAQTGCFGLGFERIALAFVAQHGPDPSAWPEPVRSAIGAVTSTPPKFQPLSEPD